MILSKNTKVPSVLHLRNLLSIALYLLIFPGFSQSVQLTYPQKTFDSDTCCWRKLSAEGKYEEAAQLVVNYLQTNKPSNKHSLYWHAAQLFAKAGNNKTAVKYIRKTYNGFYYAFGDEDAKTWYLYAKGVECFLLRKKDQLKRIIARWDKKFTKEKNFLQLQLLYKNWDLPYQEAVH